MNSKHADSGGDKYLKSTNSAIRTDCLLRRCSRQTTPLELDVRLPATAKHAESDG
jgi:hypothetical protein